MTTDLRQASRGRAKLHLVDGEWITIREGCRQRKKDLVAVKNKVNSGGVSLEDALNDKSIMTQEKRTWLKENAIPRKSRY